MEMATAVKKIKLGVNLINYDNPRLTGTALFAKRLFESLRKYHPDAFEYHLFLPVNITQDVFGFHKDDPKVKVIQSPYLKSKITRILYKFFVLPFKIRNVDILFSPTPWVPFYSTVPLIPTIHDLVPLFSPVKYGFFQHYYFLFISWLAAKKAKKIITVSQNSKQDIIEHLKVKETKIEIIYNHITELEVQEEQTSESYFLIIGKIQPGKNLIHTMTAFDRFVSDSIYKDFELLIVGEDGWNVDPIYAHKERLKSRDKIKFLGYVAPEQLNELRKKMKALIYLSFYEGFGLPPLEAMYFGKPSIVSSTSSLPEVVGNAALLVNPHNIDDIVESMEEITKEEVRKKLQEQMQKQITKFSPENEASKFLKVITEAIEKV